MFVFLQSWRATLIPAIAVPVVLLGTFAVFYVAGFTINTLTLFGLVLAIGLLVDDAIVVVENVERLMEENPRHDPARGDHPVDGRDPGRAGRDRAGAVGGVPADGVLRRLDRRHLPPVLAHHHLGDGAVGAGRADPQPGADRPLCSSHEAARRTAARLRSTAASRASPAGCAARRTGSTAASTRRRTLSARRSPAWSTASGCSWRSMPRSSRILHPAVPAPAERLPADRGPGRGAASSSACRPARPSSARSRCSDQVEQYFAEHETSNIKTLFTVAGGGGGGAAGQNTGQGFINLIDWDERQGKENTADAIAQRALGRVSRPARRAGVRAGPRRDPRPRPVDRLHHGAAEHAAA